MLFCRGILVKIQCHSLYLLIFECFEAVSVGWVGVVLLWCW